MVISRVRGIHQAPASAMPAPQVQLVIAAPHVKVPPAPVATQVVITPGAMPLEEKNMLEVFLRLLPGIPCL